MDKKGRLKIHGKEFDCIMEEIPLYELVTRSRFNPTKIPTPYAVKRKYTLTNIPIETWNKLPDNTRINGKQCYKGEHSYIEW